MYRGMNNKNNKTEVTACLSSSHLAVLIHGIEAFNKFMYSTLQACVYQPGGGLFTNVF